MTSHDPDVTRTIKREERDSIVTRRREGRLEEIAAVTGLQTSTITHADPVIVDSTMSTRYSSVEQNKTTNGYRSGKREVDRETSVLNIHIATDRCYSTVSVRHPQHDNEHTRRSVGVCWLNTSTRTTITKAPSKRVRRNTTRENSSGKRGRTTITNIVASTDSAE